MNKDQKSVQIHTCNKCKKTSNSDCMIRCLTCKKYYDFDCLGISKKLHQLKDVEARKKWKCKICTKPPLLSNSSTDNVTKRKKCSVPKLSSTPNTTSPSTSKAEKDSQGKAIFCTPSKTKSPLDTMQINNTTSVTDCDNTAEENLNVNIPIENTFSMLSEDDESDHQEYHLTNTNLTLRRSCPDLHASCSDNTQELKCTISKLQTELASAHNEIQNLLSDKFEMQKQLATYQAKVKQLTLLCKTSTPPSDKNRKHEITYNGPGLNLPLERKQKQITNNHQLDKNTEDKTNEITMNNNRTYKQQNQKIMVEKSKINTDNDTTAEENKDSTRKHRAIILADQQGRHVQQTLQELIGTKYDVFCIWKPDASLPDILSSCKSELDKLGIDDYVVIIGFRNDSSIFTIRYTLASWVKSMQNTNIIVCESAYNSHLNEIKLNNEIKYICSHFHNARFLDLGFSRWIPRKKYFTLNLCRNILQEILRLHYNKISKSYEQKNKTAITVSTGTQTEPINLINCDTETTAEDNINNTNTNTTIFSNEHDTNTTLEFFRE